MIVGDVDRPAARGRLAARRDVAAEGDEHPTAGRLLSAAGRAIGRQRLGRRAEIERHAARHADPRRVVGDLDLRPP
jgi:hypothetical protein